MSIELQDNVIGNGGGGGTKSGINLYDIKTLSQAIAEKGFACLSHNNRKDIPKTDIPTVYNDIKNKFDNAELDDTASLVEKASGYSVNGSDVIFVNGYYYCAKWISQGASNGLYKSEDGQTWELALSINSPYMRAFRRLHLYKNKIYFMYGSKTDNSFNPNLVVYDITNGTGLHTTQGINNFTDIFVYDDKVYFYNADTSKVCYVGINDIDETLSNAVETELTVMPIEYDGVYFYGFNGFTGSERNLFKGSSIDAISTLITTKYTDSAIYTSENINNKFYIPINNSIYYVDNGTITEITTLNTEQYAITQLTATENTIYVCFYNGNKYSSQDGGDTFTQIYSTLSGQMIICSANGAVFGVGGTENKLYFGELAKKVFTDTYVIDGSSVVINYYKNGSFKICQTDNDTNDENLDKVYQYLGYHNYFAIDITEELLALPRNSNLWTMMYVGDNYQDENLPEGNVTRLLPQAEIISDSSANVSLNVEGNKDYQLTASALTALTLSSCEDSQLGTTIRFTSGTTATTITDSASIDWVDGATPIPSASVNCLIFIWNKIGFYKEW